MRTFQQRVNEKMEDLLIVKVAGGNGYYENLREAISEDDATVEAVFNLIFADRMEDYEYRELIDTLKHEIIAYFGTNYEDECSDIVHQEDLEEAEYQREMAE